jgi:hypothetical protein
MSTCKSVLFGSKSQYIKVGNGELIAIDGATISDRLMLSDLRIPYKQILKSRIILKPGQVNYLLNHLGIGDNVTFLAIKVNYNTSSVIEDDNYIIWNYYDDFSKLYPIGQFMILTGNSTNRIKQIYLTNPNGKYPVILDIMTAVIDDEYSFYSDDINQVGLSFTNLNIFSIETHVPNQSIVIWNNNVPRSPLAYIQLSNINSFELIGKLLIIDDTSVGRLFLDFDTNFDASQVNSLINYALNNENIIIQNLSPLVDNQPPIIYFNEYVDKNTFNSYILESGFSFGDGPFNTGTSSTPLVFSATMSLVDYGGVITKNQIIDSLIDYVVDNRDGTMSFTGSNIILYDTLNIVSSSILSTGTYSINFIVGDIAGNSVNPNTEFNIYVI